MIRWRLLVVPAVVAATGLWAASFYRPPEEMRTRPTENKSAPNPADPKAETLEQIMARDPVAFLEMSLKKYDETIKGYALTFDKHERIKGVLRNPEKCEVRFRENPFAVHMRWLKGAGLASHVLYIDGENNGKMLARGIGPLALFGLQTRDVDGADAKSSGRFTISQFGFKKSTQRSLASMKRARERGKLFVKYEGIVPVEKLGGQLCYKFFRKPYDPPDAAEDDLNELELYFDTENWLQVGSILRDVKGQLLGEYMFSDVRINPEFTEKQFTREAL